MKVLICRDWRSVCSTWLWITTVTGAVLVPAEIQPDVLSWEQGEPDAANRWSSRMMGGRGQDGYWQLSWDVVKEGIREWSRKGVLTSEELAHLPLKVQCFQKEIKRFIFGPEHTHGLNLRLKMGWNWLQREWYTYRKHYSVDFCGVFSFSCPCCCFRWAVLAQQWITWWQKPCPTMRICLNLGHGNLRAERLEALPAFNTLIKFTVI